MSDDTLSPAPLCLTDAGLETWLIFQRGRPLRDFAAFECLLDDDGRTLLEEYYRGFLDLAAEQDLDLVLETPTWRANGEWGTRLGWSERELADINREAVAFLDTLRKDCDRPGRVVVSGNIGPRGDGYVAGEAMSVSEAQAFHAPQVDAFARSRADRVAAVTMTSMAEAAGVVRAAGEADIPCVISFTLETDGRLPSGERLGEVIEAMDANARTRPFHYMVNCAHPDHFTHVLDGAWTRRIHGVRANASRMSHAELDACDALDDGDPDELGRLYGALRARLPALAIVGGCCGTDHRHVRAMGEAVKGAATGETAS